jgi:hypothetical protein
VITAYSLAFGGFLLLGGRAADLFGRRKVFMLGMALFTLGRRRPDQRARPAGERRAEDRRGAGRCDLAGRPHVRLRTLTAA